MGARGGRGCGEGHATGTEGGDPFDLGGRRLGVGQRQDGDTRQPPAIGPAVLGEHEIVVRRHAQRPQLGAEKSQLLTGKPHGVGEQGLDRDPVGVHGRQPGRRVAGGGPHPLHPAHLFVGGGFAFLEGGRRTATETSVPSLQVIAPGWSMTVGAASTHLAGSRSANRPAGSTMWSLTETSWTSSRSMPTQDISVLRRR